MTNEQIEKLCKEKELGLLNKYYGNLVNEAAIERLENNRFAAEDRGRV